MKEEFANLVESQDPFGLDIFLSIEIFQEHLCRPLFLVVVEKSEQTGCTLLKSIHNTLTTSPMRPNNSILYFIKVPDIISLSNGLCGVLAISFSINHQPMIAALLIGLGGIFDYLDGKVARAYGISSEFGKQLDSLCDLISFILAPAVFAYTFLPDFNMLKEIILMGYVGAGLLRLARFNVTGTFENGKYFEGLPVPFSILIIFSYFFLQKNHSLLWLFLYVIHGFLMLSIIKIRKL